MRRPPSGLKSLTLEKAVSNCSYVHVPKDRPGALSMSHRCWTARTNRLTARSSAIQSSPCDDQTRLSLVAPIHPIHRIPSHRPEGLPIDMRTYSACLAGACALPGSACEGKLTSPFTLLALLTHAFSDLGCQAPSVGWHCHWQASTRVGPSLWMREALGTDSGNRQLPVPLNGPRNVGFSWIQWRAVRGTHRQSTPVGTAASQKRWGAL